MVDKIRVILADDHQMVRQGFVSLLSQEADIEVIGEAENAQDAVELAEQVPPDVLVADWEMPGMSCQDAIRLLKEHRTPVRVLVLTMHRETEQILKALRAGACGYVIKNAPVSELVHGIRAVGRGDVFLSPGTWSQVVTELMREPRSEPVSTPLDALTGREREVFQSIARGQSRQEIAQRMSISPKTVDSHRANLLQKLGLENDAALIRLAVQRDLVPVEG